MPGNAPLSDHLGLAPEREGQPRMMTISDATSLDDGHWYSPAAVREMLAAERERRARLLDASAVYWQDHIDKHAADDEDRAMSWARIDTLQELAAAIRQAPAE